MCSFFLMLYTPIWAYMAVIVITSLWNKYSRHIPLYEICQKCFNFLYLVAGRIRQYQTHHWRYDTRTWYRTWWMGDHVLRTIQSWWCALVNNFKQPWRRQGQFIENEICESCISIQTQHCSFVRRMIETSWSDSRSGVDIHTRYSHTQT